MAISRIIAGTGVDLAEILAIQDAHAKEACDREFPDSPRLRTCEPALRSAFLAGQDTGKAAGLESEYEAQHDLVFAML